ncbi:beta-1,3-galactosyltransferase brn-like [Ylistrum balloti]|uniref:beta-1,3-galactosyltransferase brn-like n=1 Tax=Ylistrum balloti TaxID=509963 RepID=UPI002905C19C|nr:beta-1,3-galactosyltransferase brn-like [Ylistrum balloti]
MRFASVKTVEQDCNYNALPFRMFSHPLDINFTEFVETTKPRRRNFEPINVYPYSYLQPVANICKSTKGIFLLFMIKSAPGNFDQRQVIRKTWTNQVYFEEDTIRHVFLLARSMNKTINHHLSLEKLVYGDIVEMTYVDDYYNNTYKTMGGINWCVRYCSKSKFVMLVDDDFYVATDYLLNYLHGLPQNKSRSLFAGHVSTQDRPQRCRFQKWYISISDYPFTRYPPFINAGAIIMSMDFVKRLQIAMQYTKVFKFDDVFLAIVAYKLNVKPINIKEINLDPVYFQGKMFNTLLASHGYGDPIRLWKAWYRHLFPDMKKFQ